MEEIHNLRLCVEDCKYSGSWRAGRHLFSNMRFEIQDTCFTKLGRKPGENILSCKDFPGDFQDFLSSWLAQPYKHTKVQRQQSRRKNLKSILSLFNVSNYTPIWIHSFGDWFSLMRCNLNIVDLSLLENMLLAQYLYLWWHAGINM